MKKEVTIVGSEHDLDFSYRTVERKVRIDGDEFYVMYRGLKIPIVLIEDEIIHLALSRLPDECRVDINDMTKVEDVLFSALTERDIMIEEKIQYLTEWGMTRLQYNKKIQKLEGFIRSFKAFCSDDVDKEEMELYNQI